MTIVTARPPQPRKRTPKASPAVTIADRIVTAKPAKSRRARAEPDDVEVSDSVKEFFSRMIKPYP